MKLGFICNWDVKSDKYVGKYTYTNDPPDHAYDLIHSGIAGMH